MVSLVHFLLTEPQTPGGLFVAGLIGFLALSGIFRLLQSAVKRYRHFQDKSPRLTLTGQSLDDHRTGTRVNLADVVGIQFNQKSLKGTEVMADLCLTLRDESVSVFDLRELDVLSLIHI